MIWLKVKLDHIGIVVEKLDKEILDFYQEALGCLKPRYFQAKDTNEDINYVYLPFPRGDNYVELLAPVRGPCKDFLNKNFSRQSSTALNNSSWSTTKPPDTHPA